MTLTDNDYGTRAIDEAGVEPLEVWENPNKIEPYLIHIEHPEFTALCPRSGYPDFGTIVLDYVPAELVIELKAIKLYINSFRQERISHEAVINKIADTFYETAKPRALRLIGDFMRRGNIKTVITVNRGDRLYPFPTYQHSLL